MNSSNIALDAGAERDERVYLCILATRDLFPIYIYITLCGFVRVCKAL
jgi:hypothetical protein